MRNAGRNVETLGEGLNGSPRRRPIAGPLFAGCSGMHDRAFRVLGFSADSEALSVNRWVVGSPDTDRNSRGGVDITGGPFSVYVLKNQAGKLYTESTQEPVS